MPTPRSLDELRVTPCPRTWDSLRPVSIEDRQRHCDACQLQVIDLAKLTRPEAKELINSREGRLCVMTTRDAEGRLVTRGSAPARPRRWWSSLRSAALLLVTALLAACPRREPDPAPEEPGEPDDASSDEELRPSDLEALRALGGLQLMGYVGD